MPYITNKQIEQVLDTLRSDWYEGTEGAIGMLQSLLDQPTSAQEGMTPHKKLDALVKEAGLITIYMLQMGLITPFVYSIKKNLLS